MKILNYILKTLRNPNPTRKKKLPFHLPIISNDHIINSFLYVRDFIYHIIILLELNYFLISARIKLLKTWIRLKKRKEKSSGTSINIINPTTSNTCFQIFIFFSDLYLNFPPLGNQLHVKLLQYYIKIFFFIFSSGEDVIS